MNEPRYIMKNHHQTPEAARFSLYDAGMHLVGEVTMPLADAKAYADSNGLQPVSPYEVIRGEKYTNASPSYLRSDGKTINGGY